MVVIKTASIIMLTEVELLQWKLLVCGYTSRVVHGHEKSECVAREVELWSPKLQV